MFNITGNQAFDLFIITSDNNKQKVLNMKEQYPFLSIEDIFEKLEFKRSDFTDLDYKTLMQYID